MQEGLSHTIPLVDCHVHSTFSPDAEDTIDSMCEAAVAAGLSEICFTDHADFEPRDESFGYMRFEEYRKAIQQAANKWDGVLRIGAGVEADYQTWYTGQVEEFLAGRHFDFVLGSVHWVDSLSMTGEVFDRYGVEGAYRRYLENVLGAAKSGLFDALAHLDFIKRYAFEKYGQFPLKVFSSEIETILKVIIDKGIALEINTSGLRRPERETLPGLETFKLYRQLGGELITIGSDAHRVRDLGSGILQTVDLMRGVGFRYIAVFRNRRPEFITIV